MFGLVTKDLLEEAFFPLKYGIPSSEIEIHKHRFSLQKQE